MKKILKVFFPTLISYMTFILISIIDSIFIGQYFGVEGQSAVSIVTPLLLIITSVTFSLSIGANTFFGHAFGEKNEEKSNKIFNTILIYGTIFVTIITLIIMILAPTYFSFFTNNQQILEYSYRYGMLMCLSMLLVYVSVILTFFQRTVGNSKLLINVAYISLGVNIFFNTIFVSVMDLSIEFIAVASIISPITQLVYIAWYYKKNKKTIFEVKKTKFEPRLFAKMFLNGLSDGIFDIANAIIQTLNNYIIIIFVGAIGLSYTYVLNMMLVITTIIFFSLSDSINPVISVSYGAKDYREIKLIKKKIIKLSLILGILAYIILMLIRGPMFNLFGINNKESILYLMEYSKYYFLMLFFFGVNQSHTAYFTAIGKTKISLIYGVLRNLAIIIFITIIFSINFGSIGLWSSYCISEFISLLIVIVLDHFFVKKELNVKEKIA